LENRLKNISSISAELIKVDDEAEGDNDGKEELYNSKVEMRT